MQVERIFDNSIRLLSEPLLSWVYSKTAARTRRASASLPRAVFSRIRYFYTILSVFTYSKVFLFTKNHVSISEYDTNEIRLERIFITFYDPPPVTVYKIMSILV